MRKSLKEIIKIGLIVLVITGIFAALCLYAYNKQRQRAVIEMADKVLTASEHYAILQIMDNNVKDVTINFPNDNSLDIRGNIPQNGYVKILSDSRIEIKFHYNRYCVTKCLNENNNKFKKIIKEECLEIKQN